jgi:hypothetical protein
MKGPNIAKVIKYCLLLEEQYCFDNSEPLEIERIWGGTYNEFLIMILTGKDAIFPYRYQAFRVLRRIADNFEYKVEE